jgi:hypothetical protein
MEDIVPKNSPWIRKSKEKGSLWDFPRPTWKPVRMTGRFKFRKTNSVQNLHQSYSDPTFNRLLMDDEYPNCNNQFRQYCDFTSLHGFRYIMEEKRNISER